MFKNLITYRIGEGWQTDAAQLAEQLAKEPFLACAPTQPLAVGWAPPRGIEHAPLVEVVDGHWLLKLKREQRLLPSSVVNERVDELCEQIEEQTGRKPGKKAKKELKEQATHELLPMAFTKQAAVAVWIDPKGRLLVIDSGSHEFEGIGGVQDIAEAGNPKLPNWNKAKGEHKRFMSALLASPMHVVLCLRAREKAKPEKQLVDGREKTVYVDLGLQPITEKNVMFEATVSLMLHDQGRRQDVIKCPAALQGIMGRGDGYLTMDDGRALRNIGRFAARAMVDGKVVASALAGAALGPAGTANAAHTSGGISHCAASKPSRPCTPGRWACTSAG